MHSPTPCLSRARRTVALCTLGALALGSTGLAQTPADLEAIRAEMKAARELYEARIAELEKRLAAVEQSAPAPAAAPTWEQRLAALEASSKETAEALDEVFSPTFVAEGLPKDVTRNFEFHGYLRAGYGVNQSGGGQKQITHPDGLFEIGPGRLGNEADTYGELTFKYNYPTEEGGPKFAVQSTLAYKYAGDKSNYTTPGFTPGPPATYRSNGDILFREAFVTASNVLANAPEVQFWAGQRFYDRHDIHINDYYFLDMSGYGGGVENIPLGPGKLAVAYLGGTKDDLVVDGRYTLTKQAIDFRWSDLPTFGGKGMLWVAPMYLNGGSGVNPGTETGVAVGWVQFNTLSKGFNKWSVQYGYGPASQFNTYVTAVSFQPTGTLDDAETLQFTNQTVWQFSDKFSVMGAGIVNYADAGFPQASSSDRLYVSAIVRPIYMFTKHLGLETEFGLDWADDTRYDAPDQSTTLGKITVAGVIKPSGAFWARPELRAYVSYFHWDGAPGYYAPNGVKAGENSSWNFGVQAETWW